MEFNWIIECRLGEVLNQRGIKKGWLANEVGASIHTVGNWINKGQSPDLLMCYRVAEVLDLEVTDIWVKVQTKKPPTN